MTPTSLYETVFNEILHEVHIWELVRDDKGTIKTWRLLNANSSALRNWGKTLAEVQGKTTDEIFPGVDATASFMPIIEKIFREGKPYSWEVFFEGTDQTLQMTSIPLGEVFISTGVDVTQFRRSERDLKISQHRLAIATEAAHIGIWEYDLTSQLLIWDNGMYKIYGIPLSRREQPFTVWQNCIHQDDREKATYEIEAAIKKEADFKSEFRITCQKTGTVKYILADAVFRKGVGEEPDKLVGVNIDISERKKAEQEIEILAYFDTLTGLPNRSMIEDRLSQSVALSERTNSYSALLFIDVDNFKKINDTAGHAVGDELIKAFADRICKEIRKADTFGRFGGDEFVIILNNLDEDLNASIQFSDQFAEKVIGLISEPFLLSTGQQAITASFGICLFRSDASPSDILRQADFAMYRAKESGRNCIHFYDPDMQQRFQARVEIENDLFMAIHRGEIEVFYQIQMCEGGKIRGAEALARWKHPTKGYIPPAEFIPVAEDTGKIKELGALIFTQACRDFKNHIQQHADSDFVIAINVSAVQIFDSTFTETIQEQIRRSDVLPSQIKIELTESAIVDDPENTCKKMLALRNSGLQFALDDFGTGYSNLTILKRLPIDELKIDHSFVRDILSDPSSSAIAKSVIVLAESMGLKVIAEGVEDYSQKHALNDMGCSTYQGFLFSKPLPLRDFISLLKEKQKNRLQ